MKQILLLTILVLVVCLQAFGQEENRAKTSDIIDCGKPIPDFKENPWEHTSLKFQNLILAVQGEPGSKGFVIFSVTNSSELKSVMKLQKKLSKSMKMLGIPQDRILLKIKKGEDYKVDFEFIPLPKN